MEDKGSGFRVQGSGFRGEPLLSPWDRSRSAFTLVELGIVIVVMGILAALLLPAITKGKEKARNANCKSNLRNLQIAAMNYHYAGGRLPYAETTEAKASDNKYYHSPPTYGADGWVDWTDYNNNGGSSPNPGITRWWGSKGKTCVTNGTLWQYTGESMRVYLCPTFARKEVRGTSAPDGAVFNATNTAVRSYAMNSQLSGANIIGMTNASRYLLFADMSETNRMGTNKIASVGLRNSAPNSSWRGALYGIRVTAQYPSNAVAAFHDGKGNAVFLDGHVESLLWSDTTNACAGRW